MTINLQFIFITSLISKKTKWLPNERKIMFKSISMAGACSSFKPSLSPSAFKSKINELLLASS